MITFQIDRGRAAVPITSMVAYEPMIPKEWESFDTYPRNREGLFVFPSIYNERGHSTTGDTITETPAFLIF